MAGSRKCYKRKRRSCPLCHPNKTGHDRRWKAKELEALPRWERDRRSCAMDRLLGG